MRKRSLIKYLTIFSILFSQNIYSLDIDNKASELCKNTNNSICYEKNDDARILSLQEDLVDIDYKSKLGSIDAEKAESIEAIQSFKKEKIKSLDYNISEIMIYLKSKLIYLLALSLIISVILFLNKENKRQSRSKIVAIPFVFIVSAVVFTIFDYKKDDETNGQMNKYFYKVFENALFDTQTLLTDLVIDNSVNHKVDILEQKEKVEKKKEKEKLKTNEKTKTTQLFNSSLFESALVKIKTNQVKTQADTLLDLTEDNLLENRLSLLNESDITVNKALIGKAKFIRKINIGEFSSITFNRLSIPDDIAKKVHFEGFVKKIENGSSYKDAFNSTIEKDVSKLFKKKDQSYVKMINSLNFTAAEIYKRQMILDFIKANIDNVNNQVKTVLNAYCYKKTENVNTSINLENDRKKYIHSGNQVSLYCSYAENDKLETAGKYNNKAAIPKDYDDIDLLKNLNINKITKTTDYLNKELHKKLIELTNDYIDIEATYFENQQNFELLKQQGFYKIDKIFKNNMLQDRSYFNLVAELPNVMTTANDNYVYIADNDEEKVFDAFGTVIDKYFNRKFVGEYLKSDINYVSNDYISQQKLIEIEKNKTLNESSKAANELSSSAFDKMKTIVNKTNEIIFTDRGGIQQTQELINEIQSIAVNDLENSFYGAVIFNVANKLVNSSKIKAKGKATVGKSKAKTVTKEVIDAANTLFNYKLILDVVVIIFTVIFTTLFLNMPTLIITLFKPTIFIACIIVCLTPIFIFLSLFNNTTIDDFIEKSKYILKIILKPFLLTISAIVILVLGYLMLDVYMRFFGSGLSNIIKALLSSDTNVDYFIYSGVAWLISTTLFVGFCYLSAKNSFQYISDLIKETLEDVNEEVNMIRQSSEVVETFEKGLTAIALNKTKNGAKKYLELTSNKREKQDLN